MFKAIRHHYAPLTARYRTIEYMHADTVLRNVQKRARISRYTGRRPPTLLPIWECVNAPVRTETPGSRAKFDCDNPVGSRTLGYRSGRNGGECRMRTSPSSSLQGIAADQKSDSRSRRSGRLKSCAGLTAASRHRYIRRATRLSQTRTTDPRGRSIVSGSDRGLRTSVIPGLVSRHTPSSFTSEAMA